MSRSYYQDYSTRPGRGHHFHLLARGSTNPKLKKQADQLGILPFALSLAPATASGAGNICPLASPGCSAVRLNYAGRGGCHLSRTGHSLCPVRFRVVPRRGCHSTGRGTEGVRFAGHSWKGRKGFYASMPIYLFKTAKNCVNEFLRFAEMALPEAFPKEEWGRSWLIPQVVFLLILFSSPPNMLPAQSEKDVATLEGAEALCRAGSVRKAQKSEAPFVSPLEKCQSLEFTEVHRLGPGQPLFGHVQGLEVNERFFFVTSTTENRDTAYLYVYLREGDELRPPVQQYDLWKIAKDLAQDCGALEDGPMNHPSGIHLAGGLLYVALARSENRGPSCIMALDLTDLLVPKVEQAIRVEDHVGALVRLHYNDIIGFNWDSDDYWWLELGAEDVYPQRATVKEMLWGKSAEKLYLQDCDQDINLVLCGQNGGGEDALVKIYKVGEFGLEAATLEPRAIRIPPLGSERGGTYEGLAWYDGQLFLMPDDGDQTGVNIYEVGCVPSS